MMFNRRSGSIDMLNGSLYKNILLFAVPLMLSNLLQNLFHAADTVVVGRFAGQQALAAVGSTGSLNGMVINMFVGLSVGCNVLVARYIGAGDRDKVRKSVHTSITMAGICGLLIMVIGYFVSRPMLEIMDTPSDILDLSALYMRINFVGAFFSMIFNFGSAILRAKGETKRPLYYLTVSGVVNVILNLIFVIVFEMSVAGVALATVFSNALSATLVILSLLKQSDDTKLDLKQLSLDFRVAGDIIKIGVPAGIQSMMYSISNTVVQSSINSFGSSVIVAANSAASNISAFIYIWSSSVSQACVTFTSQNIGAGNYHRLKKIAKTTMVLTTVGTLVLSSIVCIFGNFFIGFYTTEINVIELGKTRLLYVGLPTVINSIADIFVSSMRGMGYSLIPTASMLIGICGIRLIWLWTVFPMHRTLETIYMCYPVSWIIAACLLFVFWIHCHKKITLALPDKEPIS